jgi:hypothetical protein
MSTPLCKIDLRSKFYFGKNYELLHKTGGRKDLPAAFRKANKEHTVMIDGGEYYNVDVIEELCRQLLFRDRTQNA